MLIITVEVLWFLRRLEPLFLLRRGLLVRRGLESVVDNGPLPVVDVLTVVVDKVEMSSSAISLPFSLIVTFIQTLVGKPEVRGGEVVDEETVV